MSNRRIQYWSLDQEKTDLEKLIPLLKMDYQKESDGFLFEHKWLPSNGLSVVDEFVVKTVTIASQEYKYLPVFAKVEAPQIASEYMDLVSKEIAISHSINPVIFIEVNNRIKVIVSASSSCFSRIRNNLMRYVQQKINLWGHIDYHGSELEKDFFYWLLSKRGKKLKPGNDVYEILDVEGFRSHTERELQKFQGTGRSIDTVVPFKTMVCLHNNFTGLDLVTKNQDDITISFSLSNDWEIKIDTNKTFQMDKGKVVFFNDLKIIVFLLYLHIIPQLYCEYNSDKTWVVDQNNFRKTIAAQAIKEILSETGLTIPELGKLLA
ncbi:hypothetical protein [Sporomusa silvacetica]|uniref:hypothetical protein n=1 Tax=Sporomusa silvacetica TaxID=55504 RepID=UPI00118193DB|nr:hypothetical protein [Sporomusa silvacetica]